MENHFQLLSKSDEGTILCVKLVPNSSHNKIADFTNEYLRIKITAPPIENKANHELISFCSDLFNINKSQIKIVSGEKSKLKKVLFKNSNYDELSQKIMFMINSLHQDK